ncbi:MAG: hypothetical protein AB1635_03430 [Acidobacteriota bacterium]
MRPALAYTAVTLVMTWPLALHVGRDVPADLGDSLLNLWILGWVADGLVGMATGALSWTAFWNAGIFHPDPLALGLSEHLVPQGLLALPIYYATGNLILAYNLVFLSSFVLCGLGTYLLVRDLTGHRGAAFVAGLVFAFAPAKIAQFSHIQVMSSQWMPFALFGLRRFVLTGRPLALAGGSAAVLLQGLSCGYFLLFFTPLVPLFVIHQMSVHGRLSDRRTWLALAAAGLVVALLLAPFLLKYAETQSVHALERRMAEVSWFSADVSAYLTAPAGARLWGPVLQAFPRPEGELFMGATAWLLAAIALVHAWRAAPRAAPLSSRPLAWLRLALIAFALAQAAAFVAIVATGGFVTSVGGVVIRATDPLSALTRAALTYVALLIVSPGDRARARAFGASPAALAAALLALCVWLSLGPEPQSAGDPIRSLGIYGWLYESVPGFSGLRVPARFAFVGLLFLAVLAGLGLAALAGRSPQGTSVAAAAGVLVLVEGAFVPIETNRTWGSGEATPPGRVYAAAEAPPVYRFLASLPDDAVLAHFPFGDAAWELRFVYYASVHRKRILNGYSGAFPAGYSTRQARLRRYGTEPDDAWRALADAGTTHVVIHPEAFAEPAAAGEVGEWLTARGARLVALFDDAGVFELPRYTAADAR